MRTAHRLVRGQRGVAIVSQHLDATFGAAAARQALLRRHAPELPLFYCCVKFPMPCASHREVLTSSHVPSGWLT